MFLSNPEIDNIKDLYFDCNVSFNSLEDFDFLSLVLNYYDEKESLNKILEKIKYKKNNSKVIFYYFNQNFHSKEEELNSYMDEKFNFFYNQISKHFPEFRFFKYFRHIYFYI